MSRKTVSRYDSLEVLLDTMCNIFGGLILIAVLVTLLCRQVRLEEDSERRVKDDLARLKQDVAVAEQFQAALRKQDPDGALARQVDLKKKVEALASQNRALDQRQQTLQKQADELRKDSFESRAGQADSVQARLDRARTDHAAEKKRQDELQQKLDHLVAQSEAARKASSRMVRFPKEQQSSKRPFHVIVQGNHLYPLMFLEGGKEVRNEKTVAWSTSFLGETCEARLGVPTKEVEEEFRRALANLPGGDRYVLFWVADDSFEIFNRIKEETIANRLEYGWRPVRGKVILASHAGGTTPPPL